MTKIKDERLQIRLDPSEKRLLEQAAAAEHLSVSAFVLRAAALRAEEVLAQRSVIHLSQQGAEALPRPSRGRLPSTSGSRPRCGDRGPSAGLTELRRPEPLDPARHDREGFDCGEPALDEWLRRYAGQNRRRDTAATWVIADRDERVVAYASLAMTAHRPLGSARDARQAGSRPDPRSLLGRLAVDRRYAGAGIGTALVAHVLATADRAEREGRVPSERRDGDERGGSHVVGAAGVRAARPGRSRQPRPLPAQPRRRRRRCGR